MRAVQIALVVICIQVGLGIVTVSGLFNGIYYESQLTNVNLPRNVSALSTEEQTQASINVMNTVFDALTWGWIKIYFEPFYSNDTATHTLIDYIVTFLNAVSLFIIGVALIEFVRDRVEVLS